MFTYVQIKLIEIKTIMYEVTNTLYEAAGILDVAKYKISYF